MLRDDLIVLKTGDAVNEQFSVQLPESGETFEFGAEEWFLLQKVGAGVAPADATQEFRQKFGKTASQGQLEKLLAMAADWGLFEGARAPAQQVMRGRNNANARTSGGSNDAEGHATVFKEAWRGVLEDSDSSRLLWVWGDPGRLFLSLAHWMYPLRKLVYVLPALVLLGLGSILGNSDVFMEEVVALRDRLNLFQHLIFSMLTVNLLTQVGRGMVCQYVGADVSAFGIRLLLGVIPRFGIQTHDIYKLGKAEQLWTHATPVLIRLGIFGLASCLWLMSRGRGTELSTLCLLLTIASLTSFILTINPLIKANGYLLLSAWLEIPGLREKANRALIERFSGGNPQRRNEEENQFALQAYAVASMIFVVAAGMLLITITARWLEFSYKGTGVALFLVTLGYLVYYFRQNIVAKRRRRSHRISVIQKRLERRHGEAAAKQFERQVARVMTKKTFDPRKIWNWKSGIVLLILAVIASLPYPYETGGAVSVMPKQRQEIFAEIEGTVQEVFFNGGEAVVAGTVLARQMSADERNNLVTNEAAIREQQAKLDQLLNSPTVEELQLAIQRLDTARTEARFKRESADRLLPLSESGDISVDSYEEARRKADVSQMEALEAEANLAKVKAGPHPQEIDAARFELERLTEQRRYYQDKVDMTELVMPFDGRIVTRNLDFMRGNYLDEGDLFAVVENDETVIVEVEVPESDIADVEVGARVKVKVWAYSGETFVGAVKEISPAVEDDREYRVVVVTTEVPNPDGLLRSGMTGFAKVESGTKPVIVAFTRMFVRFFLIKIWSWLP